MSLRRESKSHGGYGLRRLLMAGLLLGGLLAPTKVNAACEATPVTTNTPTGIAGCVRWGDGIASMFGPGDGVAMNFCTWTLRHSAGCGSVMITAYQTGLSVTAPVIDFCDCYTGTANERIIDLQYGVVDRLGLDRNLGLWLVRVEPVVVLPDTRME